MSGISFDPVADSYDATRALPEPLMEAAVAGLAAVLGTQSPVLEAGVGTGRFAVPLRARGVRVVGVDIAPRMLAHARAKGARDLFLASATRLPFRDRAFDSSLAIHVLHLVPSWREVLREIARVTRTRFATLLETVTTAPVGGGEATRAHGDAVEYPMPRYQELARERGYAYEHPGVRPPQMIAAAEPVARKVVGTFRRTVAGADLLEPIAAKTHSCMWHVPDAAHAEIMAALRREVEDRTFERTWEIEVVAWAPRALLRM